MGVKQTFKIEKKVFVVNFSKIFVKVSKKRKAFEVTIAIEIPLVKWLIAKFRIVAKDLPRTGFIRSKKGAIMDMALNCKKNEGGFFLSLICFSSDYSRGFKSLCIPQGRCNDSCNSMLYAFCTILDPLSDKQEVIIRRKSDMGKVVTSDVDQSMVDELREGSVDLVTNEDIMGWFQVKDIIK